jgi:hypothetical protein
LPLDIGRVVSAARGTNRVTWDDVVTANMLSGGLREMARQYAAAGYSDAAEELSYQADRTLRWSAERRNDRKRDDADKSCLS